MVACTWGEEGERGEGSDIAKGVVYIRLLYIAPLPPHHYFVRPNHATIVLALYAIDPLLPPFLHRSPPSSLPLHEQIRERYSLAPGGSEWEDGILFISLVSKVYVGARLIVWLCGKGLGGREGGSAIRRGASLLPPPRPLRAPTSNRA